MKIAIIVAMQKELDLLLPLIDEMHSTTLLGLTLYHGRIADKEVAVAQCGIGKVNASLTTFQVIDAFSPDLVINSGVAGGADKSMRVLDLFVAESVAYHDVWCGPGTIIGQASGFDLYFMPSQRVVDLMKRLEAYNHKFKCGLICSGDRFISTAKEIRDIKHIFPEALAVDMESASIAQVCTARGVEFAIIRAISDTPGEAENISQYENFWNDAPAETFASVRRLVEEL